MRTLFLFCVVGIGILVVYMVIPTERMQSRAKDTIQQAQSFGASLTFEEIKSEFDGIFDAPQQPEKTNNGNDTPDLPVQSVDEADDSGQDSAVLIQ